MLVQRASQAKKIPQGVRGEVALSAAGGFQLDESPARGVERAHQRDAHAQYDQPVAHDDACGEVSGVTADQKPRWRSMRFCVFTHLKPGFWQ